MHDVERVQHRERAGEHRWNDGEILGYVIGDRERSQCTAGHQQLFSDFHHFNEFRRVGIEVHHVAGFLGRLSAGIHRDADVGLRECRRIVRAIAGHGHQFAATLLAADQIHLVFRSSLRKKIIDTGLTRNGSSRKWIVPRNHDGADSHGPKLVEAVLHSALNDVLEFYDTERTAASLGYDQRRASSARDLFHAGLNLYREFTAVLRDIILNGVNGALTDLEAVHVDARHARLRGEWDELSFMRLQFATAEAIFFFCQNNDGAALRRFVRERR